MHYLISMQLTLQFSNVQYIYSKFEIQMLLRKYVCANVCMYVSSL